MAKVIREGVLPPRHSKATYVHTTCGALIEFDKSDVQADSRDGAYVICPWCRQPPLISVALLHWTE
jgi:hypothetical protein